MILILLSLCLSWPAQQEQVILASGVTEHPPEEIVRVEDGRWIPIRRLVEARPAYRVSKFVGLTPSADIRFDLIPKRLVASHTKSYQPLWSLRASDSIQHANRIDVLCSNAVLQVDFDGKLVSSKQLPRGYTWRALDSNRRFVIGFRNGRQSESLVAVHLESFKISSIPVALDFGREEVPRIVSKSDHEFLILREESPGWCQPIVRSKASLVKWAPAGRTDPYWVSDVTVQDGTILLLVNRPGYRVAVVESWPSSLSALPMKTSGLVGFVRDLRRDSVLTFGYDGRRWFVVGDQSKDVPTAQRVQRRSVTAGPEEHMHEVLGAPSR